MTERIVIATPDMSCGHCVATIEDAVGALPGVVSVAADLSTKRVEVVFDPGIVSQAVIEETLDDAGYPVRQ